MQVKRVPWHERELRSFDRQSRLRVRLQQPQRYRDLEQLDASCPRIARGGGVSYVAASFDREAVSQGMRGFDHLLDFDPDQGTLSVEAGINIADLQAFAMRRGWYLAIAPGHPQASVGGCIAANVHGKNPARDGCFEAQVLGLRLFHPGSGWTDVERGDALWRATCGGFGLTGSIVSARLQLRRAPAVVQIRHVQVADLAETAAVMREHADALLIYGWHNGRAKCFGRGAIQIGASLDGENARTSAHAEFNADSLRPRLPAAIRPLPFRAWNPATLALANLCFAHTWQDMRKAALAAALTPLNHAGAYFAAFGPAGMIEAQWLVAHGRFDAFANALAQLVRKRRPLISLISSKLFAGDGFGPAFDGHGIALALHVPANPASHAFLRDLDELALAHGGRPNPIKQSGLDAATLSRAIPELADWRTTVAAHNPGGLYRSELSRRLELS